MERDFLELMPHTIQIKRAQRDASGNAVRTHEGQPLSVDTPDRARGLVTGGNSAILRKSMTGEVFHASTMVHMEGPVVIAADDQIILPDGTSPTLLTNPQPEYDETGFVHHTVVHCA